MGAVAGGGRMQWQIVHPRDVFRLAEERSPPRTPSSTCCLGLRCFYPAPSVTRYTAKAGVECRK